MLTQQSQDSAVSWTVLGQFFPLSIATIEHLDNSNKCGLINLQLWKGLCYFKQLKSYLNDCSQKTGLALLGM
jgi:hypothetical protein